MTEELDLVTFDAGGTLFDMSPSRDEVFIDILSKRIGGLGDARVISTLARADRKFDDMFALQDGKNEDPFWRLYDEFVFKELGIDDKSGNLHAELDAAFRELIPDVGSWRDFPETRAVLERMRARDFKMGVVSNATDLTKRVLDNLDLTRFFDFVIVSAEVGYRKPDPAIFNIAAKKGEASLYRSLHVGDKYSVDVLGARRAGMNAVLLDRGHVYDDVDCIRTRTLDFFPGLV